MITFVDHFQINVSPDKGFVESEEKKKTYIIET